MIRRPGPLNRSYLYAPASNDRILAKVLERGADAVILDLEDGVAAAAKDRARAALAAFLDELAGGRGDDAPDATPPRVLVRINRDGMGWSAADLEVAVHPAVAAISLPKAELPAAVTDVGERIAALEAARGDAPGRIGLHLLVESAAGVMHLEELARIDRVERFGLGAADLHADLGITGRADPAALDHVRGRMVVASRAAGIGPPVDSVHTAIDDLEGLRRAALRSRGFGFLGKSAVHPAQVAVINDVFTPSDDELAWARRIVTAAAEATARGDGAANAAGELVDAPVLARAQALLRLAPSPASDAHTDPASDTPQATP